jgi:hypothetical protein
MAELHNTTSNLFSGYLQNRHMVRSALTPYWQEPWGDWTIVGIARPDNDDGTLFVTEEGEGILINGSTGKTSNLIAIPDTGDCNLTLEFMVPKGSNSGVYLMGRYEVQIFDSWGVKNPNFSDCGGIYQRDSKSDHDRFEGRAPDNNMSKKPGDWQKFEIEFRAPRFDDEGNKTENARFIEVVHNGQVIHENVEVAGPTRSAAFQDEQPMGPLMLQGDHGPVAFRNVSLWWKTDHPIGVDGHPRKSNSE